MDASRDNKHDTTEQTLSEEVAQLNLGEDGSQTPEAQEAQEGAAVDPQFLIKHPLQNRWAIWYDSPQKKTNVQTWADNLKRVTTFDTVEDFWRVFNCMKPASQLAAGSNYHLFKDGVEPKWEDPHNSRGGKWIVTIPNKNRAHTLDQMWLFALLACIGESFGDASDEVCGVVISLRKQQDKLSLWTRDSTNAEKVINIGRLLKMTLELPEKDTIGYQSHVDALRRQSSFNNKNLYDV